MHGSMNIKKNLSPNVPVFCTGLSSYIFPLAHSKPKDRISGMSCSQSTSIYHSEWRMKMSAVGRVVMLLKDPDTCGPLVKKLVNWEMVL